MCSSRYALLTGLRHYYDDGDDDDDSVVDPQGRKVTSAHGDWTLSPLDFSSKNKLSYLMEYCWIYSASAHGIPRDTRKYRKTRLFSQSPLSTATCPDTKAVLDFVVMPGDTIIFLPWGQEERETEIRRERKERGEKAQSIIRQRNRARMKIPLRDQ